MRIQLLESHGDESPQPVDVTWEELVADFRSPPILELPADQLHALLEKGVGLKGWIPAHVENGQRGGHNVTSVSCLVLDFDSQTSTTWRGVLETLEVMGVEYFYHSTRNHVPMDGEMGYRVVIRLSRSVLHREWTPFWSAMAAELGSTNDKKCKDPGRLYYLPVQVRGRPAYEFGMGGEIPLDVEMVLAAASAPTDNSSPTAEARRPAPARLEEMVKREPKAEWAKLGYQTLRRLLGKDPGEYAPQGERDNALFAVANFVAKRAPDLDPQAVVDLCRPGLALEGCRHADGTTLLEKLQRAQEDVRAKLQNSDPVRMWQLGREGPYTQDEISEYVARMDVPNAECLTKQLLLKNRNDLYCFYLGDYVYVGSVESGEMSAVQKLELCTSLGVQLMYIDKDANLAPKPFSKILREHGHAVDHVVPALHLPTSKVENRTLWHAVCPRRLDLIPVYDAEIQEWLESWGDDRLLDWLATAARLEKGTAALFLRGAPKAGKTMLAKGVAAIWGKPPTSMASLGEQWNDAITENPIVLADDSVPQRFREDSGLMRELVTADTITLNRKFMNTAKVHGSIRLIFCKNNLDLFASTESVTRDDVDAICERLLYYRLPSKVAPYFHPNRLAQHFLWLEQERAGNIPASSRLWVEGIDSELHRHMRVSSRERSLVCQWLMSFLHAPHRISQHAKMFRLGSGELLINPRLIYDTFDIYLSKERPLALPAISKVMNELGRRRARGLYSVNLEDLAHWGELNSWELSVPELEALVNLAADSLTARTN